MAVYVLLVYCDIDIICMYTDETGIKIYIYDNKQLVIGLLSGFRNVKYDNSFNHYVLLNVIPRLSTLWSSYECYS